MLKDIAYHAIADMIYRGALFTYTEISGYSFIFKTLNMNEYNQIRLLAGPSDKIDYGPRYNSFYMAYSVFMVDGENVLIGDKQQNIRKLYEFFSSLSYILHKHISNQLMEFRDSIDEIAPFIEGFCYTQQSREHWLMLGNARVNDDDFCSIPGMKVLGLNEFQEIWENINRYLDQEEHYDEELSMALLIASSNNPKGTKKIRSQHDANLQNSKDRRKKIAKEGFNRKSNWSTEGWAQPVDTAEELVAELERQMQGLKDRHDILIEKYLNDLQEESDRVMNEEKRKIEESVKKHEDEPVISGSQRALTPEEAQELFKNQDGNNLVIVGSEEQMSDEEAGKFYKKVGSKILTSKK